MSRELTVHEVEVAEQREVQLRELQAASADMLLEINARIGIEGRDARAGELDLHLRGLRAELEGDPMLGVWWLTRLGVWIAWTLTCECGGEWMLDRDPQSRSFLRAVLGNYPGAEKVRHDPMQIAAAVTDAGEDLEGLLAGVMSEIV